MASLRVLAHEENGSDALLGSAKGFRHLLVCLDGSIAAEAAIPLACHVASFHGARLTLLRVLVAPEDRADVLANDALTWAIVREEARVYLNLAAARALQFGVTAEVRVTEGAAAQGVASMAAEVDADVVVLSSHGAGGVDAWSLGGTAQKILALVGGALLVVPVRDGCAVPRVPPVRIFVPLDGSRRSECALPVALRMARAGGGELCIAHMVADSIRNELLSSEEDLAVAQDLVVRLESRAAQYLDQICANLGHEAVRATRLVRRGADHREGLLEMATSAEADLIVMSAHGSGCNAGLRFGSVTSHVVTRSKIPVLVIPDVPEPARSQSKVLSSRYYPSSRDVQPN